MRQRKKSDATRQSHRRTLPELITLGRMDRVHGKSSRKPPSLDVRERVFTAVAAVRRADARGEKLSVTQAARQEGTTVAAIKRFAQLLKRTKPGQPLQVTKNDSYFRNVNILI